MSVYVLDNDKKPLMPCSEKRARLLLERGRARVVKVYPFTIRLVDRKVDDSELQPLRIKIDPGSKTTGLAVVRDVDSIDSGTGEIIRGVVVVNLVELEHRGSQIRDALTARRGHRRCRRSRLRYREARFLNRKKDDGWLPPSEWDFATFEDWVSEKTSEAYNRGDCDRGYWDSVCGAVD